MEESRETQALEQLTAVKCAQMYRVLPMQGLLGQVKEFRCYLEGSREPWKVKEQVKDHTCAVGSSLCQQRPEEIDTSSRNTTMTKGLASAIC